MVSILSGFPAWASVLALPTCVALEPVTGTSGTLVVVVPAKEGLVIASDTRSMTLGVRCDGNSKIIIPKAPRHSVIAATGTATWVSARFPLWANDPCADIAKNGIVFLDAKSIAAKFLEEKNEPIWDLDLKGLAESLIAAISDVSLREPMYVKSFAGKTVFQVVLAAYDPVKKVSYLRALQINLTAQFQIEAKTTADHKFELGDSPDYPHFGDTDTFTKHVMLGIGKQFLPSALTELREKANLAEVTRSQAEDVAVSLIEAAKRTSELVPELSSIGGPIEAFFLGSNGPIKLR
jgi:hypothetical protein